ncbi:tail fiber assembly protein [Erwinia rhapontici]|uniref:tail fiber assembly protein n=1 Tax=Erwinia rhapontici TaxID=55212 RepID=UPI0021676DE9|nr:tail fiber assembly protein [Erwinia rhapontici]MCS3608140.1 hypothetical protein [Erwinia rhapontici]
MNYVFSASGLNFYPLSLKDSYVAAGSWPTDGVEIDDSYFEEFSQSPPDGKSRGAVNGMPAWVESPPLTEKQLVAYAESEKAELLALARISIAPLQDAVDIGVATSDEIALLKKWKQFSVSANRTDTSKPLDIVWPAAPAS